MPDPITRRKIIPRYDLKCLKCQKETIIYFYDEGEHPDPHDIACQHCFHKNTELIAFYRSTDEILIALQQEIEKLKERIDAYEIGEDCNSYYNDIIN